MKLSAQGRNTDEFHKSVGEIAADGADVLHPEGLRPVVLRREAERFAHRLAVPQQHHLGPRAFRPICFYISLLNLSNTDAFQGIS